MANIKYWFHAAASLDSNGLSTPVLREPSILAGHGQPDEGSLLVTPGATIEAPLATEFITIETDFDVRYTVRKSGDTTTLATANCKRLITPQGQIAIKAGQSIHFIDA